MELVSSSKWKEKKKESKVVVWTKSKPENEANRKGEKGDTVSLCHGYTNVWQKLQKQQQHSRKR
ncbi:hypothetical protein TYRP_005133 [Tyrophagus putrescentiae]|nr:hypothetical protein TYRP_005133 [Tyrophagus putrescentiae]